MNVLATAQLARLASCLDRASAIAGVLTGALIIVVAASHVTSWVTHEALRVFTPGIEILYGVLVYVVFGVVEMWLAVRPRGWARAGGMLLIAVLALLAGLNAALGLDVIGAWLVHVGMLGVVGGLLALVAVPIHRGTR